MKLGPSQENVESLSYISCRLFLEMVVTKEDQEEVIGNDNIIKESSDDAGLNPKPKPAKEPRHKKN